MDIQRSIIDDWTMLKSFSAPIVLDKQSIEYSELYNYLEKSMR